VTGLELEVEVLKCCPGKQSSPKAEEKYSNSEAVSRTIKRILRKIVDGIAIAVWGI
jgi:hypothetical protein